MKLEHEDNIPITYIFITTIMKRKFKRWWWTIHPNICFTGYTICCQVELHLQLSSTQLMVEILKIQYCYYLIVFILQCQRVYNNFFFKIFTDNGLSSNPLSRPHWDFYCFLPFILNESGARKTLIGQWLNNTEVYLTSLCTHNPMTAG